jgi:myo-inositol-1(or 4)-monophosphatase
VTPPGAGASGDGTVGDDPVALRDLAVRIAHRAGALLLGASTSSDRAGREEAAHRKSSRTDLTTTSDRASEALVREALARARPGDALLAEEGGETAGSTGLTWVVDPLDGTTNFVYDYPAWAVSIAAVREGRALAGVVHDPGRGETFAAAAGAGATLNGRLLRLAPPPPLAEALVATGFGYSSERRALQAALLPTVLPAVRDLRRGGSAALDLCYLAAGRVDAFYEAGLQPWDRAAGLLVAAEAGAPHGDLDGPVPGVPTLACAPPGLFEDLCDLLRRAAPGPGPGTPSA